MTNRFPSHTHTPTANTAVVAVPLVGCGRWTSPSAKKDSPSPNSHDTAGDEKRAIFNHRMQKCFSHREIRYPLMMVALVVGGDAGSAKRVSAG